ncbi:hypothetical protein Tco_1467381 [Tanacetum coccineum]
MVAILEKTERNADFHQIMDFLEASTLRYALLLHSTVYVSPNQRFSFHKGQFSHQWKFLIHTIMQCISPKSTAFNEFCSNIATAIICLATNRTYNFSKMIFDGMIRNVNNKGTKKFLMYPRFLEKLLKMSKFGAIKHSEIYLVPFQTQKVFTTLRVNSPSFSGRTVPLFDTMIVQKGEGSENQPEPHHTPSPQHSKALSPVADETAPLTRGDRHGEAFPTASSLDAGDSNKSTDKGSESTGEMENVLSSMRVSNVLASGGLKEVFTTASPPVPLVSSDVPTVVATASATPRVSRPSRGVVIRSTSPISINIPYVSKEDKRKGKEIMIEPEKTDKSKARELMSDQLARELETKFALEDQAIREQIERDAEIARIQAEEDLRQIIDELDRSNEMINKHMAEYEKAENYMFIEEKTESQLDKMIKDFKEKNERLKRIGILLEKGKEKRLKTGDGLAQEQQTEDDKKKESEDQDKIINLQQWVVLVRQESSVDINPLVFKAPICDWKIFKDRLREFYQVFRVGQVPKVYPYFETMLKNFDREDVVTLWKLVKDRFKEELPKSNLEKCLFLPLKVMFEPVATDGIWQFEAPIKSWKLFKSCSVHCLKMEGMIIYMLNDVEYPLQKSTLQKMLDHKCEVSEFNEEVIQMINLIKRQLKKE